VSGSDITNDSENLPDVDVGVEEFAWINDAEDSDLSQKVADCIDRWHNASPEARKKDVFSFCCSGHLFGSLLPWTCPCHL
jgi:hypothetical protein